MLPDRKTSQGGAISSTLHQISLVYSPSPFSFVCSGEIASLYDDAGAEL